jgi:FdhE protein
MDAARQAWLASHRWLEPVARFQDLVDESIARGPLREVTLSAEAWADEHASGVPLLHAAAGREVAGPAAEALGALVERLAAADIPGKTGAACRALRAALSDPEALAREVERVVSGSAPGAPPPHAGLLRLLGWSALRRLLAATLASAAPLRAEERWGRAHCPTCGALPGLAHLATAEGNARARALACGCCGTRWAYRRIGCPFCGNEAPDRLGILEAEGAVRLDVCEDCKGYVKTCVTDCEADLFLADWPTLHLDLAARHHGFKRVGASLYEI